tara:strand:- start:957 stop:2333 length:1377 start_codon:yes stop_codon:yes gene_type:complete
MHSGPHIITDGLVFGYDTGQFSESNPNFNTFKPHRNQGRGAGRFFKGKPITNFIAYQNAVAQDTYTPYSRTSSGTWDAKHPNAIRAYNAQGSDLTGYVNSGVTDWTNTYHAHWQFDSILRKPVVVMDCFDSNWKAKSFDCNTSAWSTYGMTTGSKYVISWLQWTSNTNKYLSTGIYCKNTSGSRNFYDGRSGNEASVKNTKTSTWQRVYKVYTISSAHDVTQDYQRIYMYGHYGTNGAGVTVKIADVQLELNTDHPTAFLDSISTDSKTSRSSTASILDLAKTTDIDVSNVSFNSDGLPTFDGTDDIINTGMFTSRNPTYEPLTIEAIVKSDTTSNARMWLDATSNGTNQRLYCALPYAGSSSPMGVQASAWSISTPQNTDFHHIVITMNGTTCQLYLDGVAHSSKAYTSYGLQSINIGGRNGYRWIGKIPVVKMHNKALSATEVEQNFKAYKNRFDI